MGTNIADIRDCIDLIIGDLNDNAAATEACRGVDYVFRIPLKFPDRKHTCTTHL